MVKVDQFSEEMITAILEAKKITKDLFAKGYDNFDELFTDLKNEKNHTILHMQMSGVLK